MMTGRLLGLDHGLKRIGVAVSDATGLIARELTIIQRSTNQADFARLQQIIQQEYICKIVIGLPHNDQATEEQQTQANTVRRWTERFRATISLPTVYWDEQLTSLDARELSIQKGRKARDPIDDLAARVMLQSYLDALRDGLIPMDSRG
jgi:putative Holliday junction resolvase